MQIMKSIESRRAYRAFTTKPIEKKVLNRLVQAAHFSPSSLNSQPWRIITVVDEAKLDALKATLSGGNYWAKKAPVIAAFITNADWGLRLDGRDFVFFELGMAAMAYQLQAVEEGLYVHPIAGFNADEAKKILKVPEENTIEVLLVLGYPGDPSDLNEKHQESENSERNRKPLEEIASFDLWNDTLIPPLKA